MSVFNEKAGRGFVHTCAQFRTLVGKRRSHGSPIHGNKPGSHIDFIRIRAMNCVLGPDVATVGWIPYYKTLKDIPPSAFRRHPKAWPAFALLFDSGNPSPPKRIGRMKGFMIDLLWKKRFRGALALADVQLYCDPTRGHHVKYRSEARPGYTPFNAYINGWFLGKPKTTLTYSLGDGTVSTTVEYGTHHAMIHHWIKFKIGKIGNFAAWMFSGQWAPWAWLEIRYRIQCEGAYRIDFGGTYLPSQTYYADWREVGMYNMLEASQSQIDGFLSSGDCHVAPGRTHFTISGRGTPC